ncbi:hypothetical protein E2C01_092874 [Portunus trituberculatus]|uniref:Uncharacterized protein n=1 Tax=Portunus trituberculatus TaxID=210409 RepID=A0A5B7JZ25_PORTR|nr:hypothetical protein [Portunus trituberculatus]
MFFANSCTPPVPSHVCTNLKHVTLNLGRARVVSANPQHNTPHINTPYPFSSSLATTCNSGPNGSYVRDLYRNVSMTVSEVLLSYLLFSLGH